MSYSRETLAAFSDVLRALYAAPTPEAALQAVLPKLGELFHSWHAVLGKSPTDGCPLGSPRFPGPGEWVGRGDPTPAFINEPSPAPIAWVEDLRPGHHGAEFMMPRPFSETAADEDRFHVAEARDRLCFGFRRPNAALEITLHRETPYSKDEAHLALLLHEHIGHAFQSETAATRGISKERGAADFFRLRTRGLTHRECEVVFWIAQGKRDVEIAAILGCARRTVSKHVENILAKLGVETRLAAAHVAQEWLRRDV